MRLSSNTEISKAEQKRQQEEKTNQARNHLIKSQAQDLAFDKHSYGGKRQEEKYVKLDQLVPDINNARPDYTIDDEWLEKHLHLSNEGKCKVKFDYSENNDGKLTHIPSSEDLGLKEGSQEDVDWTSLRDLVINIDADGLDQPIIFYFRDNKPRILIGHRRTLAHKILLRISIRALEDPAFTKAFNEEKPDLKKIEQKIFEKQVGENTKRQGYTNLQKLKNALTYLNMDEKINRDQLAVVLDINTRYASAVKRIIDFKLGRSKNENSKLGRNTAVSPELVNYCFSNMNDISFRTLSEVLKGSIEEQSLWVQNQIRAESNDTGADSTDIQPNKKEQKARKTPSPYQTIGFKIDKERVEKTAKLFIEKFPDIDFSEIQDKQGRFRTAKTLKMMIQKIMDESINEN